MKCEVLKTRKAARMISDKRSVFSCCFRIIIPPI
jgi:hypothetical protein